MCHLSLWTRLDKVCQIESPSVMCLSAVKRCANRQHSATQRTMSTNLHCTRTSPSQHFYLLSHRPPQAPPAEAGECQGCIVSSSGLWVHFFATIVCLKIASSVNGHWFELEPRVCRAASPLASVCVLTLAHGPRCWVLLSTSSSE